LTEVVALGSNDDKTPMAPEVILESADTHEDQVPEVDELTSSGEVAPKPADLIAPVKTEMEADDTKLTSSESKSKRRRRRI